MMSYEGASVHISIRVLCFVFCVFDAMLLRYCNSSSFICQPQSEPRQIRTLVLCFTHLLSLSLQLQGNFKVTPFLLKSSFKPTSWIASKDSLPDSPFQNLQPRHPNHHDSRIRYANILHIFSFFPSFLLSLFQQPPFSSVSCQQHLGQATDSAAASFPSSAAFDAINNALASDDAERATAIKQADAVFVFNLTNEVGASESWTLDLKSKGVVERGGATKADGEF